MKKILLVLLSAFLCISFCACGDDTTDASSVDDISSNEQSDNSVEESFAESTEAPAESEESPAESTEAPVESEESSAESTEAPVESEESPAESTEAPAESEESPAESTEAPAESEESPAESTEAPIESEDLPEENDESKHKLVTKSNATGAKVIYSEELLIGTDNLDGTPIGTPDKFISGIFPTKQLEENKDALFFVAIEPDCYEFLFFRNAFMCTVDGAGNTVFRARSYGECREAYKWMQDLEMKNFARFGIEVELHWYGYAPNPQDMSDIMFLYPPTDDTLVGKYNYFYTAYATGEALLNYKKAMDSERNAALNAFKEKYGDTWDIADNEKYGLNYVPNATVAQLEETAKDFVEQWETYADEGVRAQYPCGGVLTILPDGLTEYRLAELYYKQTWMNRMYE